MIKSIRKKVASTVSEIELTENFAWGKWLKEPSIIEHRVESFQSSIIDTNHINSWLEKTTQQKQKFDFKEVYVFPELKNLFPKKVKTNTVFFGIGKTEVVKINLMDREFAVKHKPNEINFRPKVGKLKEVNWKIGQSTIKDCQWELTPKVLKIDLLKAESMTGEKFKGKNSNIEFETIAVPPKIYKVKIVGLDKIKLAKIYFLKNISLHEVRLLRESLRLFSKPDIQQEELKYFNWPKESELAILSKPIVEEIKKEEISLPLNEIVAKAEPELIHQEKAVKEVVQKDKPVIEDPVKEEFINKEPVKEEFKKEKPIEKEPVKEEIPVIVSEQANAKEPEEIEEPDESEEEESETENEFESLYYFQETGAEFLLDSKRALLTDEIGLGKTVQAVVALKNLFINNKIKSAIIVCDQSEIGTWGKIAGEVDGWIGHLHHRAPELKVRIIDGTPQERNVKWENLSDVMVVSYDSFFFDIEENITDLKGLKKVNCIILDEVQNLLNNKYYNVDGLSKILNPKYLWNLSSYPEEAIKESISTVFKEKLAIKNYLGRSKKDVEGEIPEITWQNKWLTLDEEQVEDYNEAFNTAKEKVQWFLESGNPLRFNANVFTLLHQLKQVCNFSEKKGKSRKTKELLRQVSSIAKHNKKVVVFSQYDKSGTKKIEELFKKNGIKFLSYAPGMSTKDMETVLKNFNSNTSITALVTGVKQSKIKIPGEIPYVIHFDIWWNPTSLWQTEDAIVSSSSGGHKEKLNVYSYLMKGTVEERIHSLLYKKGFLNKHIMETMNPDVIAEMITNPEWLEIFDMPDEEFKQRYEKGLLDIEQRIDKYSLSEFMVRGKNFFTKLGYKNLDVIENKGSDSFDVRGIFKKAKFDQQMSARFLLKEVVTEDEAKGHLIELKEKTNNGKYFLITRGTFEGDEVLHSNEALIDRSSLSKYFYQFIIV